MGGVRGGWKIEGDERSDSTRDLQVKKKPGYLPGLSINFRETAKSCSQSKVSITPIICELYTQSVIGIKIVATHNIMVAIDIIYIEYMNSTTMNFSIE